MAKVKPVFPLFCSVAALLLFGCGPYSFNPGGGAKTIAVLLFENETTQFGVREALTDSVSNRFLRDNTLKLAPAAAADLKLSGSVVRYERAAYTYDEKQNVKQYVVRIWAKVSIENQKEKKNLWEEPEMLGFGIYDAASETEEQGKQRAVAKLAEDIVNRTVKSW
jgi:hypothetical protein